MSLHGIFAEKVRAGYQGTEDSAIHHRNASKWGGVVALGAVLTLGGAVLESNGHQTEGADIAFAGAGTELVASLACVGESSARDNSQIPLSIIQETSSQV